jgi:hypothetical protein
VLGVIGHARLNLTAGKKRFRRCVMGGLNELELAHLSREQVFQQAQEALDQVGRIGFILAPGCALPHRHQSRTAFRHSRIRRACIIKVLLSGTSHWAATLASITSVLIIDTRDPRG